MRNEDTIIKTSSFDIVDCLCGLYIMHKLIPAFGYYMPNVFYLFLFFITMFLLLVRSSSSSTKWRISSLIPLLCITFLTCVSNTINGNFSNNLFIIYGEFQILLFGYIAICYSNYKQVHKAKRLFIFVLICYIITAITTIIGCINYPSASRFLATTDSTSNPIYKLYMRNNIGGFTFVYELTLMTPIIVYLIKKRLINPIFGLAVLILFGFVMIKAEYTMALILYIISICTCFIPELNQKKIISIFWISITVLVLANSILSNIFFKLAESTNSAVFSSRFKYIAHLISGTQMYDTSMSGNRLLKYEKSWDTFFNTYGIGRWSNEGVGGHSFFLDNMAIYGIIGLLAATFIFWKLFKMYIVPFKKTSFYGYILWSYLLTIILAILNPKSNLYFTIFVIPIFSLYIYQNEEGVHS